MKDALEAVVANTVGAAGFDLVELRLAGTRSRPMLEVRIDRRDGQSVMVGDCEQVSRLLEQRLDEGDLVAREYVLQVSSPGDRPLRTAAEWCRFRGQWASVLSPQHGGRFEGKIIAVEGPAGSEVAVLEEERGAQRRIPLTEVKEARLAFHW